MTQVLTILRRVDEIIDTPDHWVKGDLAQTVDGVAVDPRSDKASCFCLAGALDKAMHDTDTRPNQYLSARHAIQTTIGTNGQLSYWNDAPQRTFDEIKDAIRCAIKVEEAKGQLSLAAVAANTPMRGENGQG